MHMLDAVRSFIGRIRTAAARFWRDDRAVSTVEYALIVVAIIAILGVAAGTMGDAFTNLFDDLANEMESGLTNVQNNA